MTADARHFAVVCTLVAESVADGFPENPFREMTLRFDGRVGPPSQYGQDRPYIAANGSRFGGLDANSEPVGQTLRVGQDFTCLMRFWHSEIVVNSVRNLSAKNHLGSASESADSFGTVNSRTRINLSR